MKVFARFHKVNLAFIYRFKKDNQFYILHIFPQKYHLIAFKDIKKDCYKITAIQSEKFFPKALQKFSRQTSF